MKNSMYLAIFSLGLLFCLSSCMRACGVGPDASGEETTSESETGTSSSEDTESGSEDEPKSIAEALNQMNDAISGMKEEGTIKEPVKHQDLKALLPDNAGGKKAVNKESQSAGYGGLKFVTAQAKYEDEDGSFSVEIHDTGGIPMVAAGLAAWTNLEMEKESDSGFERTSTYEGHKMYEKQDNNSETAEVSVFFYDRFVVILKGVRTTVEDLKKALGKMGLEKEFKKLNS